MDQKRLDELLEEATVDCYDEEEEFSGVFATLEDNLGFRHSPQVMCLSICSALNGTQMTRIKLIFADFF